MRVAFVGSVRLVTALAASKHFLFEKDIFFSLILEAGMKKFLVVLTTVILIFCSQFGIAFGSLEDGLVAWYKLDGNAVDSSGNGYNGSVEGAHPTTGHSGNSNSAMSFNGVDDYVEINAIAPEISGVGSGSISLWFKGDSADKDTGGPLVHFENGSNCVGYFPLGGWAGNLPDSSIGCLGSCIGAAYENGRGYYFDDVWHHAVFAMGIDSHALYVDGQQVPLTYKGGNASSGNCMWGTLDKVNLALRRSSEGEFGFQGALDDLRIYNRALTEAEIKELYGQANDGLVAHYKFEGDATDSAGNNDLTEHGVSYAAGKVGQAATFDGIDDYLYKQDGGFKLTNDFSISFWIKLDQEIGNPNAILSDSYDPNTWPSDEGTGINFVLHPTYITNQGFVSSSVKQNLNYNTSLVSNHWYFLTLTKSSSDGAYIYVDGKVVVYNSSMTKNFHYDSTDYFYLGVYENDGSKSGYYSGLIDDVRIYNRALTEAEVKELYWGGSETPVPKIGFLEFDDNDMLEENIYNNYDDCCRFCGNTHPLHIEIKGSNVGGMSPEGHLKATIKHFGALPAYQLIEKSGGLVDVSKYLADSLILDAKASWDEGSIFPTIKSVKWSVVLPPGVFFIDVEVSMLDGNGNSITDKLLNKKVISFDGPCDSACPYTTDILCDSNTNDVRRGVVRLHLNDNRMTGSIIKSHNPDDNSLYILTAAHGFYAEDQLVSCSNGGIPTPVSNLTQIDFNLENDCKDNGDSWMNNVYSYSPKGFEILDCERNDFNVLLAGSHQDWIFFKVNKPTFDSLELAFLEGNPKQQPIGDDGFIIHHPKGDLKKISYGDQGVLYGLDLREGSYIETGTSGAPVLDIDDSKLLGVVARQFKFTEDAACNTAANVVYTYYRHIQQRIERFLSPFYVDPNGSCGGNPNCNSSIQSAVETAASRAIIRIAAGQYDEDIVLSHSKSLILQGGWDSSFTTQTPNTTILKEAPKALQGSLKMQMLNIKP